MARAFQLLYRAAEGPVVREFDQDKVLLGRASCDVTFKSRHLARKHAEIVRDGDGWSIHDRHGISVNGARVSDRRLADGDRIVLAPDSAEPTELEFRLAAAARGSPPPLDLGNDSRSTSILASIDLPELAKSLSKSGHMRGAGASPLVPFEGSPHLSALGLFKSAAEILLANESLDDMLQHTADLIGGHMPGRRVAVCMPEAADGGLAPRCFNGNIEAQGASGQPLPLARASGSEERPRPFHVSRSILQEAARVRRALLVASAADDPRFQTAVSIRQQGIRSAICVPLYYEGRVEGAIYVDSQSAAGPLDSADLETLTVLGLLLAAGIAQLSLRGDVLRERTIRARLARYNSPQVVEEILRRVPRLVQPESSRESQGAPRGTPQPAPEDPMLADEHDVSVLFADLGGFTALAECWSAAEVVRVLNSIFERWTADVFARDGTLDKYIGDAVMAVFGAPLPQADHARRAVETARAMQRSLDDFNRWGKGDGPHLPKRPEGCFAPMGTVPFSAPLTVRIGINSGRAIAGDIGSTQHRAYTVIGDVVNIASRLETSIAQPGEIVIGQATYEQVRDFFTCESLGERPLRGKRLAVQAYRVV